MFDLEFSFKAWVALCKKENRIMLIFHVPIFDILLYD